MKENKEAGGWKEGSVHILTRPDGVCKFLSLAPRWSHRGRYKMVMWREGDLKVTSSFSLSLLFSLLPALKWFALKISQPLPLLWREILQIGIKIHNYCQRETGKVLNRYSEGTSTSLFIAHLLLQIAAVFIVLAHFIIKICRNLEKYFQSPHITLNNPYRAEKNKIW